MPTSYWKMQKLVICWRGSGCQTPGCQCTRIAHANSFKDTKIVLKTGGRIWAFSSGNGNLRNVTYPELMPSPSWMPCETESWHLRATPSLAINSNPFCANFLRFFLSTPWCKEVWVDVMIVFSILNKLSDSSNCSTRYWHWVIVTKGSSRELDLSYKRAIYKVGRLTCKILITCTRNTNVTILHFLGECSGMNHPTMSYGEEDWEQSSWRRRTWWCLLLPSSSLLYIAPPCL